MPAGVWARTVTALSFRVPHGRFALAAPLVSAAKWFALWAAVQGALGWGRQTRFGAGLIGATVPLLALEAWLTMRRHWRARLLDTLAFAVPLGALLSLGAVAPGSCCFCDHSPWAKALRNVELIADFLYFSAYATLPAFALLLVLWPRSRSAKEWAAYTRTTAAALLAILSCTVVFAAFLEVLTGQFDQIERWSSEWRAGVR
jgi:hypothetical protein